MERSLGVAHHALVESGGKELTLAQLVALLSVVAAVLAALKWVFPFIVKVVHFVDDAMGEKARPGVPARPGLLQRMTQIEERVHAVDEILHELKPNNGSSLADAVNRIECQVNELMAQRKDPDA